MRADIHDVNIYKKRIEEENAGYREDVITVNKRKASIEQQVHPSIPMTID
jgi:L-amino acid N-acyltransferase YncA